MALAALIGAYHEDDFGGLRALYPLAGRTLIEYQARCAFAAGAAPVVVLVERVPQALQDAFERLRQEGVAAFPVSDVHEAVSRFDAGSDILLIGDGIAPTATLVTQIAEDSETTIVTVPDDDEHALFERIDGGSRWAGVALVDSLLLGSTAAMLGDWDLQSTLLRRAVQEGALRVPAAPESEPLLVEHAEQLVEFERSLVTASRVERRDWASRYVLPLVEDFTTERLMDSQVRPIWLIWAAALLTIAGAICFFKGWLGAGVALLLLSTPLDLVAQRLSILRLRPLPASGWLRRTLWPLAGVALFVLGWWEWRGMAGGTAMVAAIAAAAFAEAARVESPGGSGPSEMFLFSRRNAILAAVPFALLGAFTAYLLALFAYAAVSFFLIQRVRHSPVS